MPSSYASLPQGVVGPIAVQNVVDGDTFNLKNGNNGKRVVRVLGIDTPEIKLNAPYAAEAKAFAKQLLDKREVWLVYASPEKADRYGRELAVVYCKDPANSNTYVCLNEALITNGLAFYYCPSELPAETERSFIAAQKEARLARRNLWAQFVDYDVVKTARGKCFHASGCESVPANARLTRLKASAGFDSGLSACRTCLNDADGATVGAPSSSSPAPAAPPSSVPAPAATPARPAWGGAGVPAAAATAAPTIDGARFSCLPASTKAVTVKYVMDGDTIVLSGGADVADGKKVQLLGANAPEGHTKTDDAMAAKGLVQRYISAGTTIHLQFDRCEEDAKGNYLAMVFVGETGGGSSSYVCLNLLLVEEGLAAFEDRSSDLIIYEARLIAAQQAARRASKGFWAEFHQRQARGDIATAVLVERNGRFYHTVGGSCARIRGAAEEDSLIEALDDGMIPCGSCNPPYAFDEAKNQRKNDDYFQHNFHPIVPQANGGGAAPQQQQQQQQPKPKDDLGCCTIM